MSGIEYKYRLVDEMAVFMKQKFLQHEPRPDWRENPLPLAEIERWLLDEVRELMNAAPGTEYLEAADVANLAVIYADVKRHGGK